MKKTNFTSLLICLLMGHTSFAIAGLPESSKDLCLKEAQEKLAAASREADLLLASLVENCDGSEPTGYADKCYARAAQKVKLAFLAAQKNFQEDLNACQASDLGE